jgi:hypothetical protein
MELATNAAEAERQQTLLDALSKKKGYADWTAEDFEVLALAKMGCHSAIFSEESTADGHRVGLDIAYLNNFKFHHQAEALTRADAYLALGNVVSQIIMGGLSIHLSNQLQGAIERSVAEHAAANGPEN